MFSFFKIFQIFRTAYRMKQGRQQSYWGPGQVCFTLGPLTVKLQLQKGGETSDKFLENFSFTLGIFKSLKTGHHVLIYLSRSTL